VIITPEITNKSSLWKRVSANGNHHHHLEMTEEEKAHVARCFGIRKDHPCKNPIYRCSECGNYGCSQIFNDKCSEQAFKDNICVNCKAADTRIPVMEKELAAYKAEWEKHL
jgi:hypothetical protein